MSTFTIPNIAIEQLKSTYTKLEESYNTIYDSPFLHLLVAAQRNKLAQLFTERRCVSGEVICAENEPGDTMYLIYSGKAVEAHGGKIWAEEGDNHTGSKFIFILPI